MIYYPLSTLMAESHVDRSIDGPGEFIQTNIVGTSASASCTFRPTRCSVRSVRKGSSPRRRVRAELALLGQHIFEPELGKFDFDLFDRAIAALGEREIKTIVCTPKAAPPRWLTHAHPEVLRVPEGLVDRYSEAGRVRDSARLLARNDRQRLAAMRTVERIQAS